MTQPHLNWFGIVRLGLAQASLGAVVVLTTSTLNRIMVVEHALPAVIPGLLVAWHFALQVLRPRWGFGSDTGGRPSYWVIGGMAVLASGGFLAALATAWLGDNRMAGLTLGFIAFTLIGFGVGASGTSVLAIMAKRVAPERRAAAATVVWVMMIAGFIITSGLAGHYLDPYTPGRLIAVSTAVVMLAFVLASVAIWNIDIDRAKQVASQPDGAHERPPFMQAVAEVWADRDARGFAIFIFVSMLAYSAQDLILEPFAGIMFDFTPGQSTKLSSVQHGGVLVGMVGVAVATSLLGPRARSLPAWTAGGCIASALSLLTLSMGAFVGPDWPLRGCVFVLGISNGAFAVSAIGSMMALAGKGRNSREGVRMGVWGAAQAIAFGAGGLMGAAAVDIFKLITGTAQSAYAITFAIEAAAFVAAATMALRLINKQHGTTASDLSLPPISATARQA
jgi:BCD family chlorophyll transporter-like MFS transporter